MICFIRKGIEKKTARGYAAVLIRDVLCILNTLCSSGLASLPQ